MTAAAGGSKNGTGWERLTYGPLMELPPRVRRDVAAVVMRGQVPTDPDTGTLAGRYAHRQYRRFGVMAVAFVLIGLAAVIAVAATATWSAAIAGVAAFGLGLFYCAPQARKAKRARDAVTGGSRLHD